MQSDSKKSLSFIDINTISPVYTNAKKAYKELLDALENIFKTFIKSEIDPEEIREILNVDDKNKNNIPDVTSIDYMIGIINRYIHEYKISNATAIFLEFKRHAAIYLFAIGSQEKSLDLLKEITTVVSDSTNTQNPDINLTCIRDCVRLNQAAIHFWLGDFEESRQLLEKVVTYYESTNEELYLIKMVNFVSVAFTYLAWIYTKTSEYEDAEKAFFHGLKILGLVKKYTKKNLEEENFINIKVKKIFIFDQLINFYTHTKQLELCEQPLMEILKIMDKKNFQYEADLKPKDHVYYYITAIFYSLRKDVIDFSKNLQYAFNIINVIYKHSESFEIIPRAFFEKIFYMIEIVNLNNNEYIFTKSNNNYEPDRADQLLSIIIEYFDEIIANYDEEKNLSLTLHSGSLVDNLITLGTFSEYVHNSEFAEFNFIKDLKKKTDGSLCNPYDMNFEINELYIIKFVTERMLFKFANIISDLVDCKNINERIVMEGLNGFLLIDNDELVLFSIYRYMVRDGAHNIYPEVKISQEEDIKEKGTSEKKLETLKVISIKNLEYKFAPLYYKRITFKLNKDAKNFNFSNYFTMINVLYSKKLYYPCVTLLSLIIEEISSIQYGLYDDAPNHQKSECFLHLFEFLLFLQVFLLISLKNYDRALFELLRIKQPINDLNTLLYKVLIGICYGHCLYYDLSIVSLCEAFYLIDPLVSQYIYESEGDVANNKKKADFKKKISPECTILYKFISLSD
jgi:hypothetical protein